MSSSPLLTITFAGPQGVATRVSSHVPRVGDQVHYEADEQIEQDGERFTWLVMGTVQSVIWHDEGVHVVVTMGDGLDEQMRAVRAGR